MAKTNVDMLNGPLGRKILWFAIPIALSSIFQQLFNLTDVAVVGQFAGDKALAAVGANTFVINLLINLFVGISVGANVVVANSIVACLFNSLTNGWISFEEPTLSRAILSCSLLSGSRLSRLPNTVMEAYSNR